MGRNNLLPDVDAYVISPWVYCGEIWGVLTEGGVGGWGGGGVLVSTVPMWQ